MVDENLINSCYRSLDRVVCLCQQPELNLKNSPPYILDTIPDLYEKLQSILTYYENNLEILGQIDYFQIFVQSLIDRCQITIRLFKDSKEKIFGPLSTARSRLIKLSLIFSHLLKDLNALFPENRFDLTNYRITKYDAAKWWSCQFQGQSIIPWTLFFETLCQTFSNLSPKHALQLKQTIDLTCNDYVSIFEFDVFTRLFQPWINIIETWEVLTIYHPGYMSLMTYDEVKSILKKFRSKPGPGTYVFRISCTKPGQWAIGYITEDLRILQTIIQNKSLAQALIDGEREGFYLFPNGKPSPRRLLHHLIHNQSMIHLQVTQEQYQTYSEVGSTFELCKICDEHNKDIQLEPCRHLICRNCFLNCQLTGNGQTCPFCRLEIKGIEEVIVDPYKPPLRSSNECSQFVVMPSSSSSSSPLSRPIDSTPVSSSFWCRQISLPDTKSDELNQNQNSDLHTNNRSLSLDMTVPCVHNSLSKDLIDLLTDCSNRQPPPIPPRHLSGSPRPLDDKLSAVQFVNESKCQSDLHASPNHFEIGQETDFQLGSSTGNSIPVVCSASCLSQCLLKSDSDMCQCTNSNKSIPELIVPSLPPPPPPPSSSLPQSSVSQQQQPQSSSSTSSILDQSTSYQLNSSWIPIPSQINSNSLPQKSDLHYAQLDLIDSDSELEPGPDSIANLNSATHLASSPDRSLNHDPSNRSPNHLLIRSFPPCSNCSLNHHHSHSHRDDQTVRTHSSSEIPSSNSFIPVWDHYDHLTEQIANQTPCELCNCRPPSLPPPPPQILTISATNSSNQSIPRHFAPPNPTLTTIQNYSNSLEQNINRLVHLHPDMTRPNALLLLTLTENRFDMSHRIWEHFQPRTN